MSEGTPSNSVKLYSNGTGVVTREIVLDGKAATKVSIPVRKSDLDEVVASINVFGDVTLSELSYTPVNANATKLSISRDSALKDTATKLAGSAVEVQRTGGAAVAGKLVGVHASEETNAHGMTAQRLAVVVLTDSGVQMVPESQLVALQFTEEAVRQEYLKALQASFQSIKPDSSFVDLTLLPAEGTTRAFVTYACPVAAWKPRYQLRCVQGAWELESKGVVDNDTEDDWKNAVISVITGEPITFETDLAEIRRPARQKINVVSDQAQGAVGVEDTLRAVPAAAPAMLRAAKRSRGGPDLAGEGEGDFGVATFGPEAAVAAAPRARELQADVRESGDFSIFTSPHPMDVLSKRSGLIPMFRVSLAEAKTVLVYNPKNNPTRPFRAVKITNETKSSLQKGVCEVFLDADFQGKCILEDTAPGQDAFLVHAKETGVKVHKTQSRTESRWVGVRIKDGVVRREQASRTAATYAITNFKAESFDLEIEHARALQSSTCAVTVSEGAARIAESPSGWRIGITLPPGGPQGGSQAGALEVVVTENSLEQLTYGIGNTHGPLWLQQNLLTARNPLFRHEGILKVIELQAQVDELNAQVKEAEEQVGTLKEDQERLMKLIPSGHPDQANAWRSDLAENETTLRTVTRTTLPGLRQQQREASRAVQDALADLTVSWSEKERQPSS
jgi:hypothetical protein